MVDPIMVPSPWGPLSNLRGRRPCPAAPPLPNSEMKVPQIQPKIFLVAQLFWASGYWENDCYKGQKLTETQREPRLLWEEALLRGDCPQLFHLLF